MCASRHAALETLESRGASAADRTLPTLSIGGKATNCDPMTAAMEQLDVIEAHFLQPLQETRGLRPCLVATLPPFDGLSEALGLGRISADARQARR